MKLLRRALESLLNAGCAFATPSPATALPWPSKPITLIVPFAPGGQTPEQFARFIKVETEKWIKVAREAGATAE